MPAIKAVMDIDWRKEINAPESGTELCALSDLESGKIREFALGIDKPFRMLVYRQGNNVFGYVNQCPHHWLTMNRKDGKFLMWSEDELMCAHHSAVFKLTEGGVSTMGPCQGSNLTRIPLQVVDDRVRIAGDG